MDIDLLSKMVKELILDNDRVVLPGLGSFVAEIVPSTFSDKGYTINPPYRRLYFRSKPNEGDVLVKFYAGTNNIDHAMAERIIRDFVAELRTLLHTRKTVVLPGLGRLRATKENNVFFVADEDLDIYPAGFGLEPVSLKTHQETKEEVASAVEELKSFLVEPETVSEPAPLPEPEPISEPASDSVPEPEPTPEPVHEPELAAEPAEADAHPDHSATVYVPKKRNVRKAILITFCIIVALVLLLLIALAIVGRMCPEWIDRFLYTPEELRILNHIL